MCFVVVVCFVVSRLTLTHAFKDDGDDDALPIYGSRLAAAKMFVELGDPADALEIVEGLLLEVTASGVLCPCLFVCD